MNPTYQHIKSGNLYEVLHMGVINATNTITADFEMVLYKPKDNDNHLFVRERNEFLEKFKLV